MKQKLTTNELVATFNYAKINSDYAIYKAETTEKYIKGGAAFLDLDELAFVKSVVYEFGKSFYILTSANSTSRSGITTALSKYDGSDSLSIRKLKADEVSSHILLQLFLNSLTNPEDEMCSYNNLSGKLMCYKPAWIDRDDNGIIWGMNCVEARVDRDMCLHISTHKMTSLRLKRQMKFEKRKIQEYPQYEFSYNNHTLRRVRKEELDDKSNLIQKPIEGDRGSVSFFDFSNFEAFSCTKNGILYEIMRLIKSQFVDYLTVSLRNCEICKCVSYKRNDLEVYKAAVAKQLVECGINVVDEVCSSTSESYLQDLCEEIKATIPGVKCSIGKRLSKKKVNIRYIHDKQFYSKEDPHADNLDEYTVQHITVENFSLNSKAAVSNILKELVIKQDMRKGKLSIVDWGQYDFDADWIFGTVIDKEYYFMSIHPDGSFDIQQMHRDLFNMTEYDTYMDYFGVNDNSAFDNHTGVVGLIKDSLGNINLIKDTGLYTLPEFEQIGEILKNVADRAEFSGADLILILRDTMNESNNSKVKSELANLIPTIDTNAKYDKAAVMKLFKGMNTKKAVTKSVFEDTGIMLYAYLRGEEARKDYLSGVIDVNYYAVSDNIARFCVGEIGSGMKYAMERASVIREIRAAEDSAMIFEEVLPLMGVEFVRYGMMTVIPFPFKYLREFSTLCTNL